MYTVSGHTDKFQWANKRPLSEVIQVTFRSDGIITFEGTNPATTLTLIPLFAALQPKEGE